jgi:NTE family protein
VDFDALRAAPPFKLFLCATNVRNGRVRIFRETELELDMPLASACLPFVFHAVQVKGEHYWDGGYVGNPALWPLFYATRSRDLVLVPINPQVRDQLPDTATEIAERVNEISFNASLLHEMRAIEFVQRLLNEKKLDPTHYRRVYLHMIASEEALRRFGASSKYNTAPDFLRQLFDLGRTAAQEWLEAKYAYLGHAGTVRIAEQFL